MTPANLLIIMSDQHNRRMLGSYGNRIVATPNLDRLAMRGALFESRLTDPSRHLISSVWSYRSGHSAALGMCSAAAREAAFSSTPRGPQPRTVTDADVFDLLIIQFTHRSDHFLRSSFRSNSCTENGLTSRKYTTTADFYREKISRFRVKFWRLSFHTNRGLRLRNIGRTISRQLCR